MCLVILNVGALMKTLDLCGKGRVAYHTVTMKESFEFYFQKGNEREKKEFEFPLFL